MALQDIINGLYLKVKDVIPAMEYYHGEPPEHAELPFVIWFLEVSTQTDYMGGANDPISTLMVNIFEDADLGSQVLRAHEQKIHDSLHKQSFTAENHSNCFTWCMERRNTTYLPKTNVLATTDIYQVYGSAD